MMDRELREVDSGSLKSADAILICTVCLTVAKALQDLNRYTTVVGGLVPSLLINQESTEVGFHVHAGTRDLDLGIDIGIENQARLHPLGERLRRGGFVPRRISGDREAETSWSYGESTKIRVDLLVQATANAPHREVARIGDTLSAAAFDGLELAFRDRVPVLLRGKILNGDAATARIYCCGPASYVVLKTQTYLSRREDKDVYDLVYLLLFWPTGIEEIAAQLQHWRDHKTVAAVVGNLHKLFADLDSPGPESYARFRYANARHDLGEEVRYAFQAEAHSTLMRMLRCL